MRSGPFLRLSLTLARFAIAFQLYAFDLKCFIAKGSPLYWQARAALAAARNEGLIGSQDQCNAYRQKAENFDPATRAPIKIMGECLCAEVFGCGDGPVTVYKHENFMGECRTFNYGHHYANRQPPYFPQDRISSFRVQEGWSVRLCDSEGDGSGAPPCATYGAGEWQFSSELNDKVSYISVWPSGGTEAPVPAVNEKPERREKEFKDRDR